MPQSLDTPQYESWGCTRTRTSRNGLAVMPVAGPWPQIAAAVALDGGLEMEAATGIAVRAGAPPVIVSPNSLESNDNRLYLGGSQTGGIPAVSIGGVKIYVIAWVYVWCILSPEGLDGDFALGVSPLDPDTPTSEYLPSGNQNANLLNQNIASTLDGQQPTLSQVILNIDNER